MEKQEIIKLITAMGLSFGNIEFIPYSKSRSKGEKYPSLNYKITLDFKGRDFMTVDYMMGCAHVPGYKQLDRSIDHHNMVKNACETGKTAKLKPQKILPELVDVLYSIVMDSDVLNTSGFEDWANNYGYDTDSRQAEKIYQSCLEQSLKFKGMIGQDALSQLIEAYQDY